MCIKVKSISSTENNNNNLILDKIKSDEKVNDYLITLFNEYTINQNRKVSIIGEHEEIRQLQVYIDYKFTNKTLLPFGTVNFSRIKEYTLKRMCKKIEYLRFSRGIEIFIIQNINILIDYNVQKDNICNVLEKMANLLNIKIIWLEKE